MKAPKRVAATTMRIATSIARMQRKNVAHPIAAANDARDVIFCERHLRRDVYSGTEAKHRPWLVPTRNPQLG
jgi:hypothetical protein